MMTSRIGGDFSKVELIAAIVEDLEASFAESGVTNFGKIFLITGGGVETFLAFGLSKLAASALKAGYLPLEWFALPHYQLQEYSPCAVLLYLWQKNHHDPAAEKADMFLVE